MKQTHKRPFLEHRGPLLKIPFKIFAHRYRKFLFRHFGSNSNIEQGDVCRKKYFLLKAAIVLIRAWSPRAGLLRWEDNRHPIFSHMSKALSKQWRQLCQFLIFLNVILYKLKYVLQVFDLRTVKSSSMTICTLYIHTIQLVLPYKKRCLHF